MFFSRIGLHALVLFWLTPDSLQAQYQPGERLRVGFHGSARRSVIGTLTRVGSDTIYLDDRPIALAEVRRLDVSEGPGNAAGLGARIGGTIGLTIGVICAVRCTQGTEVEGNVAVALAAAGTITALGMLGGAYLGLMVRRERWRPVIRPDRRGVAIGVSTEF